MICNNCGKELGENDAFCPHCGASVQGGGNSVPNESREMYNYERPQVNQQGSYSQRPNNYSSQNNGNHRSTVKVCVILVIVVLVISVLIYYGSIIFNSAQKTIEEADKANNTASSTSEVGQTPTASTTQNTQITNTSTGTATTNSTDLGTTQVADTSRASSYKVSFEGFNLYIPDNLVYQVNTTQKALNIGNSPSTWVAQIGIMNKPYQIVKQNRNYLSNYFLKSFASYNPTVTNTTVETVDGIEYVLMEVSVAGTKELIGFAQLNSMYTICFEIRNENNDFDRNTLKNLTSIIRTAEYSGTVKNLEVNEKIKASDISKEIQKALDKNSNKSN